MAGLRHIKRRITSVKNTQQITRAMKMVAAAKLRKAQNALQDARPYADKMLEVLHRIGEVTNIDEHPLLTSREVKATVYIVVTADKGLCGGFNSAMIRYAEDVLQNSEGNVSVIAVGRKASEYFRKRDYNLIGEYMDIGDEPKFKKAQEIADAVVEYYLNGLVDSVKVLYPHFVNTITRRQTTHELLPVAPEEQEKKVKIEYIFEPTPYEVLDVLLPRYIATTIHRVLLEAKAGEQGARMAAMDAATENAEEMIKRLTLRYNKARQAAITTEISEIVGGAEALK